MKTFTYKLQGNGNDSWIVTNSDGTKYISYISPIELYKQEVNEFHSSMLTEILKQHDYISLGEVPMWLGTEFNQEAQSIIDWWKTTSNQVLAHLEKITEYQDSLTFCETISIFE
jgi:hypothetical protein